MITGEQNGLVKQIKTARFTKINTQKLVPEIYTMYQM